MQKQIKYKGMSTTPSDYDCPDGDLSVCMNMVNENGLIPTDKPSALFSTEYDVVHIHKNKGYTNYILKNGLTLILKDGAEIVTVPSLREVTSIGNILIIMTDKDIRYALFKDGAYKYLGSEMPTPHIYFKTIEANYDNAHMESVSFPSSTVPLMKLSSDLNLKDKTSEFDEYSEGINNVTNAVFGAINKYINQIQDQGYFCLPFFIRYALRLYDGTLTKHSAPILINPTFASASAYTSPGGVSIYESSTGLHVSTARLSSASVYIRSFYLSYRAESNNQLTDWKDIVSSVDVFISQPIYNYYSDKTVKGLISPANLLSIYENQKVVDAYKYNVNIANPDGYYLWNPILKADDYLDRIVNTYTFYKVASLTIEEMLSGHRKEDTEAPLLTTNPDGEKMYYLKPKALNSIVSQEVMSDDFRTHCSLSAEGSYIYNSRLNLYNIGVKLKGYNPKVYNTYERFVQGQETDTRMQVSVKKEDGVTANILSSSIDLYVSKFPVFFFFPESGAERVIWSTDSGRAIIEKTLKPHPGLNGAYYINENLQTEVASGVTKTLVESNTVIYSPNQIKLSEVNNPFVFKAVNTYNIGTGEIKNVSSASKALSEGQFGQFPLYAFTTDGVWALEVSSTGTYSSKQPATRDILSGEVAQIDGAVAFITKQGLMLLSGITSQCISTIIGEDIININLLSSIVTPGTIPFNEYVQGAFLSYDYIHRRLFVINPSNTYSYCFSMRSQTWSVINESYSGYLNSYPESLLKKGNLVLTYADNEIFSSQYLITRPIKLDSEELKTITQLIQRGVLTDVQQILYGSRDGVNYRVISSSSTKRLTAHGSPYKYFVLVVKTEMIKGQSLEGLSTLFDIKFNNKLR